MHDGFTNDDGEPKPGLPVNMMRIEISVDRDITRMTIRSTFAALEAMKRTLAMGAEEGMRATLGQINAILAE